MFCYDKADFEIENVSVKDLDIRDEIHFVLNTFNFFLSLTNIFSLQTFQGKRKLMKVESQPWQVSFTFEWKYLGESINDVTQSRRFLGPPSLSHYIAYFT